MDKSSLANIISTETDTLDRDLLERLILGYSHRPSGTRRIAQTLGLDPHMVFARFERLRLLDLVSVMSNGNYDHATKEYGDIPGPTIGWIYSGGPISEFFELISQINFS